MLEEPDAVREKCNIEGDNEATVGDNAGRTEGTGNDRVAKEGGVIENKAELRFVAEIAF